MSDFKKQKEAEKKKRLEEIEDMRAKRDSELKEKEERMLNWEARMK